MPNYIYRIVSYIFLNVCEKIHQFLSRIRKDAHKRKLVSFFCVTVYVDRRLINVLSEKR